MGFSDQGKQLMEAVSRGIRQTKTQASRKKLAVSCQHPSIPGPGAARLAAVWVGRGVQQPTASCGRRTWAGWLGESKQRRALTYWEDMGQRRRRVIIDVHVGHVPNPHRPSTSGWSWIRNRGAGVLRVLLRHVVPLDDWCDHSALPQPTAGRREGCNSRVGLEGDDVARRCDSSGPIGSREKGGTPRPATGMPSGDGQG